MSSQGGGRGRGRGRGRGSGAQRKENRRPGALDGKRDDVQSSGRNPPRPREVTAATPSVQEKKTPRNQSVAPSSGQEVPVQSDSTCVGSRNGEGGSTEDVDRKAGITYSSRTSEKGGEALREAGHGRSNERRGCGDGDSKGLGQETQPRQSITSPMGAVAVEPVQGKPTSAIAKPLSYNSHLVNGSKTRGPNDHGKKQPPDRPDHGSEGRKISLFTNYFPLRLPECMTIYHYDVSMKPDKLPKALSRQVSVITLYTLFLIHDQHEQK